MTENLLKQMMAIVDAKMANYKQDFYKCDLKTLYGYEKLESYDKDGVPEFWWEVNESHTHILIINEDNLKNTLRTCEQSRFGFARNPKDYIYGSFAYWANSYGEHSDFYHYSVENGKLEKVMGGQVLAQIEAASMPVIAALQDLLDTEFSEEIKYYHEKMTIKFASNSVRKRFLNM